MNIIGTVIGIEVFYQQAGLFVLLYSLGNSPGPWSQTKARSISMLEVSKESKIGLMTIINI